MLRFRDSRCLDGAQRSRHQAIQAIHLYGRGWTVIAVQADTGYTQPVEPGI